MPAAQIVESGSEQDENSVVLPPKCMPVWFHIAKLFELIPFYPDRAKIKNGIKVKFSDNM